MQSELQTIFLQTLAPILHQHGFKRVELTSCIHDEELWRKDRLWFGVSFDQRDYYLEVSLGHLYWFHDVMPRMIVLGDYTSYAGFDPSKKILSDGLEATLRAISDTIDRALAVYENHYSEILQTKRQPKKTTYAKEFVLALGEEVQNSELEKYYAE